MSRGLTSVLYGCICCPIFYVAWSHFRSVWVSMLSDFLCHLVSLPFSISLCCSSIFCRLVSLPFSIDLYVVRVSIVVLFYLCVRDCVTFYDESFPFQLFFFRVRCYTLIVTDILSILIICKTDSAKKKVKSAHIRRILSN